MPWSAGVFTRTNGTFTGPTVWQQDAAVPVNIIASRHDTHDQDIATGLNNCATIDGLNKFAATVTPSVDATYALGSTVARWTNLYLSSSTYLYNGSTNAVQLSAGTLTASRSVTFPDAAGNVVIDTATQTLTNKTLSGVTLTGTIVGAVTEQKFVAGSNITLTGTTDNTSVGTLTITAGGGVSSIADGTNGGLSFSASTGAITASLLPSDLLTKATPTISDSVLIEDAAASNAPKTATIPSIVALAGSVVGTERNLKIVQASTTTATVSWDEVVAETALNGTVYRSGSQSLTLNFATTGANGLDTGALAANTFYSIYAIFKPSTGTWACVACTASASSTSIYSGANIPASYTASALIGFMLTDGSSHLLVTTQYDREVFYSPPINIFTGTTGGTLNTLISQSISAAVPSVAKTASGLLGLSSGVMGSNGGLAVASDSSGTMLDAGAIGSANGSQLLSFTQIQVSFRQLPLTTAQTLFWSNSPGGQTNCRLSITSFTF